MKHDYLLGKKRVKERLIMKSCLPVLEISKKTRRATKQTHLLSLFIFEVKKSILITELQKKNTQSYLKIYIQAAVLKT